MTDAATKEENSRRVELKSEDEVGRRLKRAREAKGLSLADVARDLRIDARFLEAIEAEDFAPLSGSVYVKGYLRNYARRVDLDPETVIAAFDKLGVETVPTIARVVRVESTDTAFDKVPWRKLSNIVFAVAAVAVAGFAVTYLYDMFQKTADTTAELKQSPAPDATSETALLPLPPPANVPPHEENFLALPPLPATNAGAARTMPADSVAAPATDSVAEAISVLVLEFTHESWVEVSDADGKRLFSRNGKTGEKIELKGKPPFKLAIGNTQGVVATFNGDKVEFGKKSRGKIARFTLGAPVSD